MANIEVLCQETDRVPHLAIRGHKNARCIFVTFVKTLYCQSSPDKISCLCESKAQADNK